MTSRTSTVDLIAFARGAAILLSAGTFLFLFINGSWRADNLFLVPDLILCAALVAAAAAPRRVAVPAMPAAFALTAGVLATSVSSYAVDGRLGAASLFGVVVALGVAVALIRHQARA